MPAFAWNAWVNQSQNPRKRTFLMTSVNRSPPPSAHQKPMRTMSIPARAARMPSISWREARVAALEDADEAGQRGGKGVELHG